MNTLFLLYGVSKKYSNELLGEVGHITRIENCIETHDQKRQGKVIAEEKVWKRHKRVINWKHILSIMSTNGVRVEYSS